MPSLTIIVPTLNRAKVVQSTIAQLLDQPWRDYDLWMIDQSDEGDARSNRDFVAARGDDRLHYLYSPVRNLPDARNLGLVRAAGDIVLFLDDDIIILAEDFIGAHVRAYDDPRVGGVVGRHVERMLTTNAPRTMCEVSWSGRTIFNLFGHERVEVGSLKGSNMSFRMTAVRQVGGFDRRTSLLEESDFSTRVRKAGWTLMFEPDAEIVHLSTPSGGVRHKDPLSTEEGRFSRTAYYVMKHRGMAGAVPFAATFMLIAAKKAIEFRSPLAVPKLARALLRGLAEGRRPADDALPEAPPPTGSTVERVEVHGLA